MKMHSPNISSIRYDPAEGTIFRTFGSIEKEVGYKHHSGYIVVKLNGCAYQAHQLIWYIVHGTWPEKWIDHKNGNPADNRLDNLRLSEPSDNSANKKRHKNNKSGYKGVHLHTQYNRWKAQIKRNGKVMHIGMYDTPEAAHEAYMDMARKIHGEFARAS